MSLDVEAAKRRDTRRKMTNLANTALEDIAHVHFLNLLRLETGLLNGLLDGCDAKLRCLDILEDAVEGANRSACGTADVNFRKGSLPKSKGSLDEHAWEDVSRC